MSHEGNDWLDEKEHEEEPQTTLAEDLENLVSEFSRGKISEERVVEALESIVKYYKEHM